MPAWLPIAIIYLTAMAGPTVNATAFCLMLTTIFYSLPQAMQQVLSIVTNDQPWASLRLWHCKHRKRKLKMIDTQCKRT